MLLFWDPDLIKAKIQVLFSSFPFHGAKEEQNYNPLGVQIICSGIITALTAPICD